MLLQLLLRPSCLSGVFLLRSCCSYLVTALRPAKVAKDECFDVVPLARTPVAEEDRNLIAGLLQRGGCCLYLYNVCLLPFFQPQKRAKEREKDARGYNMAQLRNNYPDGHGIS